MRRNNDDDEYDDWGEMIFWKWILKLREKSLFTYRIYIDGCCEWFRSGFIFWDESSVTDEEFYVE